MLAAGHRPTSRPPPPPATPEPRKHEWYRFTDGDRYMMRCERCGKERGTGSYPKDVLGPCDGGRPATPPTPAASRIHELAAVAAAYHADEARVRGPLTAQQRRLARDAYELTCEGDVEARDRRWAAETRVANRASGWGLEASWRLP